MEEEKAQPKEEVKYTIANNGRNDGSIVAKADSVNHYYGLSYAEAKTIFEDLCCLRDVELKEYTENLIQERIEEFKEELLRKGEGQCLTISKDMPVFRDIRFHSDLYNAQREYIKDGSKEILDILTGIISERMKVKSRTIEQIALSEAVNVAPKLTNHQMSLLALVLLFRHSNIREWIDLPSLKAFIVECILPMFRQASLCTAMDYAHLTGVGVIQITMASYPLMSLIVENSKGLFQKGLFYWEIPKDSSGLSLEFLYPSLFVRNQDDVNIVYVRSLNENTLECAMSEICVRKEHKTKIVDLMRKSVLTEDKIAPILLDNVPELKEIVDYWDRTQMSQITLSAVGTAVAAQYYRTAYGKQIDFHSYFVADIK